MIYYVGGDEGRKVLCDEYGSFEHLLFLFMLAVIDIVHTIGFAADITPRLLQINTIDFQGQPVKLVKYKKRLSREYFLLKRANPDVFLCACASARLRVSI